MRWWRHCGPSANSGPPRGRRAAGRGAFRGFGVPQAAIAQEALWDQLADACAMDQLDFRLLNALREGDRLEVYRDLRVDPKAARRERFNQQGAKTTGLFATRRVGAKAGY